MPKMEIFSVFDVKAAYFGAPFFQHNSAVATRSFERLAKEKDSDVAHNPADFQLFKIGTFDSDTGVVEGHLPDFICSGFFGSEG